MEAQPCTAWRDEIAAMQERGTWLEAVAIELGLQDFDIPLTWSIPTLTFYSIGLSLQRFADKVNRTAGLLKMPPDNCSTANDSSPTADTVPALTAKWNINHDGRGVEIYIRNSDPTGCKLDPRTDYQPEKTRAIHPECIAVLASLEDASS